MMSTDIALPARDASGARGLSSAEAARRLAADGRNEPARAASRGVLRAVGHQLRDVVIAVLLVAAALTLAVGDVTDMSVILAVIAVNTALGAVQEVRSSRALDALAALTAPHAVVVRDGHAQEVDAATIVRGDLVRLAAGDVVPADVRIDHGAGLLVDESTVSGESAPVARAPGETVHAGTVVTRGRAGAEVVAVGRDTAVGTIATALRTGAATPTPLQVQLAVLGRRLALGVVVAAVVVAAVNLAGGRSLEICAVLAISLAVAAIPESLPAVVSLALSMAAHRMSELGVLIRRLAAVEALGSVTVLAADKTGTLTEGRLTVDRTWRPLPAGAATPEGPGLLEAATLCNDACRTPDGSPAQRDDPLEVALVEAARAAGVDVPALRAAWPRVGEVPFDAASARMTTMHEAPDGHRVEICKGSPEALLPGVRNAGDSARIADDLARQGLRVLAVSCTDGDGVRLIGLVGFLDPPRETAAGVVEAFRRAGVRTVMITGDHEATASALAARVGIPAGSVHARVRPEGKRDIVRRLQDRGDIVAMTGDGVNDAAAMRAASVGVAVGRTATEVARQAADIVLTDDDLSPLSRAIGEGRRAFDNIRRFLQYALSGGVAEVVVMLLGPLAGMAVPLQAGQILWVNLLTHGLPGVAMGNEPAAPDVLTRAPRPPTERLLDRRSAVRVGVLGAVIAAVCLAAGVVADAADRPWQSCVFVTLAGAQLAVALALRPRASGRRANPMLPASVALNVGLVVLAVDWAPLRELLHTRPLGVVELAACAGASLVPALATLVLARVLDIARDVRPGDLGPDATGADDRAVPR